MLFNVKFHTGVNFISFEDNSLLYYTLNNVEQHKKLMLDFSDLRAKVQSFAILREDLVYKEKEISDMDDINNCEVEVTDLEAGKYMMRIITEECHELIEEIEITG